MNVLITGVNGFVGKHLARELIGRGCSVVGVGRDDIPSQEIKEILDNYLPLDLTDHKAVSSIDTKQIDAVVSLAGLAKVGESFDDPNFYMKTNVEVLSILGSKLVAENSRARVIAVSTGAVYSSSQPMPLTEQSTLVKESSPYVLSKLQMEESSKELRKRGLDCVIARPFNHTGPGQEPGFLLPDLYQKLLAAEVSNSPIKVGNLDTRRDYTDVRDVVKAYANLALAPSLNFDLYNICSGQSIPGRKILDWLQAAMGVSLETVVDEKLIRLTDPLEIFGDNHRLAEDTGWKPIIPINKTIVDFVKSYPVK